jgi:hypothetical protein
MHREGFEPTVPVFEWVKIVHALDRGGTVIGLQFLLLLTIPKKTPSNLFTKISATANRGASCSWHSLGVTFGRLQVRFVVDEMTMGQIFLNFFEILPSSHHSSAAPYLSITVPCGVRQP